MKPRLSPSQQFLNLSCRHSLSSVRHLSSSNHRFCHVSLVELTFDFLSTNTHAEELGTEVSNSRTVRLMQWDLC